MRILKELQRINPNVKFLLENVKMKKEWEAVLTEAIGVEGVHINSALVSAQNRKRIYWTNIARVEQPEDRGLLLRDVLQTEVGEKYFLKDEVWKNLMKRNELQDRIGGHFYIKPMKTDEKSKAVLIHGKWKDDLVQDDYVKISRKGEIRKDQDKASCLTVGGHGAGNHSDMDLICVAMRGRPQGEKNAQQLEPSPDEGKTNCLTTVQKDNLIMCLRPERTEYGKAIRKKYEAGEVQEQRKNMTSLQPRLDEKTNTLTTVQKDNLLLTPEPRIRRLTPTECARLQTIPEWYTWNCSETQQYKMLGNGWTVEVIKHIFSYLKA